MKLAGQVALIIGGARGIGETIAHTFSQEGASLVLVDLEKMKTELDARGAGGQSKRRQSRRHHRRLQRRPAGEQLGRRNRAPFRQDRCADQQRRFSRSVGGGNRDQRQRIRRRDSLQFEAGLSLLPRGLETNGQAEERQHRQHLRHRRPRRHGDARLAVRRQMGRGRPDPNYRQRVRPSWHPRQYHLPRRHGRARSARNVCPARQELRHDG